MKIAEVSKRYDISPDTLRYYERVGLMPRIARNASGIRDYSESDCQRIQFIKCMRAATMPIEPLITYMHLYDEGDHTIGERIDLLKAQRAQIQERINEMQAGLDRLDRKIAFYEQAGRDGSSAFPSASDAISACSGTRVSPTKGAQGSSASSPDASAGAGDDISAATDPGAGTSADPEKFSK